MNVSMEARKEARREALEMGNLMVLPSSLNTIESDDIYFNHDKDILYIPAAEFEPKQRCMYVSLSGWVQYHYLEQPRQIQKLAMEVVSSSVRNEDFHYESQSTLLKAEHLSYYPDVPHITFLIRKHREWSYQEKDRARFNLQRIQMVIKQLRQHGKEPVPPLLEVAVFKDEELKVVEEFKDWLQH
jgi:hypothetical protein